MTIGLTGGIGSGKSTVAKIFSVMGCVVLNSDDIAKQAYFMPDIKVRIIDILGPKAYLSHDAINKTYIAEKIFKDTNLREKINAIIHPAVQMVFDKQQQLHPGKIIVKETALLFEAGLDKGVDKIVVVTAPQNLRISRVMQRDKVSAEQVKARIQAQIPEAEKITHAHFVIHNDGLQMLIPQVQQVLSSIAQSNNI